MSVDIVGEVFHTKSYGSLVVTSYDETWEVNSRYCVEFLTTGYVGFFRKGSILLGTCKDPYYPRVCGVGYIGEGEYNSKSNKKAYNSWRLMLERVYNPRSKANKKNYADVTICDEWLNFQNYCSWHLDNYIQDYQCDKDLKVLGSRVYSPETCSYIPQELNKLLTFREASKEGLPVGVKISKGIKRDTFLAEMKYYGKTEKIGRYDNLKDAYQAYIDSKLVHVKCLAEEYKDKIDKEVYNSLINISEAYLKSLTCRGWTDL